MQPMDRWIRGFLIAGAASAWLAVAGQAQAATVLVPSGSGVIREDLCVGDTTGCPDSFSSVPNRSLQLAGNNTGIRFLDTSTAGPFPGMDWDIQINDNLSGGPNQFGIGTGEDQLMFVIEGGAPQNALRVSQNGNIGLGEPSPASELHIADGDTPTIRLEQDASSGFTAETFDIAANETNFFVRDSTNGSAIPFKIQPGAPDNTLTLASSGNVLVGGTGNWQNADSTLYVRDGKGDEHTRAHIEERDGLDGEALELLQLEGNSSAYATYVSGDPGAPDAAGFLNRIWQTGLAPNGSFEIGSAPIDGTPQTLFAVDPDGDTSTTGALLQRAVGAERENKGLIAPAEIMDALRTLPIRKYEFSADDQNLMHAGPTAPDFKLAFGFGNGTEIAPADLATVAMGAAQDLDSRVGELESGDTVAALSQRVEELEAQVARNQKKIRKNKKTARKALKLAKKAMKSK